MITTAAAWRHGSEHDGECVGSATCICTTPTPDPASPCGHALVAITRNGGQPWRSERLCGDPASEHVTEVKDWGPTGKTWNHPHVPTRCTCGHSLERVES